MIVVYVVNLMKLFLSECMSVVDWFQETSPPPSTSVHVCVYVCVYAVL